MKIRNPVARILPIHKPKIIKNKKKEQQKKECRNAKTNTAGVLRRTQQTDI